MSAAGSLIAAIKELFPPLDLATLDEPTANARQTIGVAEELLRTFVGRKQIISEVLDGTASLVLLEGGLGMGKSSVMSALWQASQERGDAAALFMARGAAYGPTHWTAALR